MTRTAFALLLIPLLAASQEALKHDGHQMVAPASLRWNPVAPGMSMAVLSGSLEADGSPFAFRLKLTDGTRVPPHWHSGDEHLTVISGTFHMGIGETVDESAAVAMSAGTFATMPKEIRHFAWASGETIVQIHGVGPFKTFFVASAKR